jgi:replicative DNA helicase
MSNRNQNLERCILKTMITRQVKPPDLIEEFFMGKEREVYNNFKNQILEHGSIEYSLVPDSLQGVIKDISKMSSVKMEPVIHELYKYWVQRKIEEVYNFPFENPLDLASKMQEVSSECLLKKSKQVYNHREEISNLAYALENISKTRTGTIVGYDTGIPLFNKYISGIQKGKFYVMGALKKTGKSRFMSYLAIKCMQQGAGVMLNSLEMSSYQLNILLLAYLSRVNSSVFDIPMGKENLKRVCESIPEAAKNDWMIYREKTVPDLRARIIQERQKRSVDVVFIDFIQRMFPVNFKTDRVRGMEEVSIALADMSRELDVAVFCLAQLSGEAEKLPADTVPNMRYFKESQGITENADVIIIMHDPKRGTSDSSTNRTFVLKIDQRYGVSGVKVLLTGDLSNCTYSELTEDYLEEELF